MSIYKKQTLMFVGIFLILFIVSMDVSWATSTKGGGLPYEDWLTKLRASVTGPVAYAFAILGIVGAGGALIFSGADMNGFLRTIVYIVLAIALIIGANAMLADFFGAGAVINSTVEAVIS